VNAARGSSNRPVGRLLAAGLLVLLARPVLAGTYNPDKSIGDTVPAWEGLVGTDGRAHSWNDLADRDAVVVVFTCNTCPYALDYEQRINDLARRHASPDSRVAVVAINANAVPDDRLPAMTARAKAGDFRFPYLSDPTGSVARSFGAVRTPECFLLDRARRIVYMGAIDDSADPQRVTRLHLARAIESLLAGRGIEVAETPPVGCMIRFARTGRTGGAGGTARAGGTD
jgi:peroxiredoxin